MKKIIILLTLLVSFSDIVAQVPPGCNNYYAFDEDNDGFASFDLTQYFTHVRNRGLNDGYDLSGYTLSLNPYIGTTITTTTYINQIPYSEQCHLNFVYGGSGPFYDENTLNFVYGCDDLKTINPNLDEDGDSVLNRLEDLNNDNSLNNEDTDLDGILNFKDSDDDGDGVLSINEDYNNNGDLSDDDINSNGIPDYLDSSARLSTTDFVSKENVRLFPNPARTHITINALDSNYQSVEVLDLSGKVVTVKNENVSNLDMSGYESGIYFIRINWIDKSLNFKIIKL